MISAALLTGASLTCDRATAQSDAAWEPLTASYNNIRGTNYVASYGSLTQAGQMPPGYNGVACSTAMWKFAHVPSAKAEMEHQLDLIKGLGLNSVRVWLSYPLWLADRGLPGGNRMTDAFVDFLSACSARNLYVVPVLWDDHCYGASPCTEPDYSDPGADAPPYANIQHWMPVPGQAKIDQWEASKFKDLEFTEYVRDMVLAAATSPALLMWDVINEPDILAGDTNHREQFVEATLDLIDFYAPGVPTTIGFTSVADGWRPANLVRNPHLDVVSIHTYGTFRENVGDYLNYAARIRDTSGLELDKPVIVTEIGQPGWGQTYRDTLDYATEAVYGPSADPTRHTGAGFFIFSVMCGWDQGNFPHKTQHGIYFTDDTVRDAQECLALQAVAVQQGVDPTTLTPSFVEKQAWEPLWFPLGPLDVGHDFDTTIRNLVLPSWYYGALTPSQADSFADMLRIVSYDIAVISAGPTPSVSMPQATWQLTLLLAEIYDQGALPGITLTQQQRNAVLDLWRFELLPYAAQLRGPTPGN